MILSGYTAASLLRLLCRAGIRVNGDQRVVRFACAAAQDEAICASAVPGEGKSIERIGRPRLDFSAPSVLSDALLPHERAIRDKTCNAFDFDITNISFLSNNRHTVGGKPSVSAKCFCWPV
jgi:hypothetical protein